MFRAASLSKPVFAYAVLKLVQQAQLNEVMQEQVFNLLGMSRSSYRWMPKIGEHLLPGTKANGAPRKVVLLQQPVAAVSLYTTVDVDTRLNLS